MCVCVCVGGGGGRGVIYSPPLHHDNNLTLSDLYTFISIYVFEFLSYGFSYRFSNSDTRVEKQLGIPTFLSPLPAKSHCQTHMQPGIIKRRPFRAVIWRAPDSSLYVFFILSLYLPELRTILVGNDLFRTDWSPLNTTEEPN